MPNENTSRLGIALVGCGRWGRNYLRVLSERKDVDLRWVYDLKAPTVDLPQNTQYTLDINSIIEDDRTCGVVVASPTNTHYFVSKQLLDARKNVLVEKPLTTSSESADELCRIAEREKLVLMVGEIFRFNPAVGYIKDYINRGEMGNVKYIESRRVGLGPVRNDVSVLWDLATHDIYISNLLVGKTPKTVSYQGISHNGALDDIVSLTMKYDGDPQVISTIYVNWEHPIKERKLIIGGTKTSLLFDDVQPSEKVVIYERGVDYNSDGDFGEFMSSTRDGNIMIPKIRVSQPLNEEVGHFLKCSRGEVQCQSSGLHGAETVKILEAAERSKSLNGQEVAI